MQFKKNKKSFTNNRPYLKKKEATVSIISSTPVSTASSTASTTASSPATIINNNKDTYSYSDTIMTTTTTTALADSISVASSTATPRMMNTTKLSMRGAGSGSINDSSNIFTTALTVRNANAAYAANNKKNTAQSPQTKRARTTDEENASNASSSSDIIPIERRPLPSARELSKVLCRIIDDETYTENDSEIALETLHIWSLKQNVAFGNHFADVGGLQQVLFFVEDHIDDPKCIVPAFWLMVTLCKPLQGASATIYESKALSNMRTKIGKCIVDIGGVHLMLRTFQYHALPHTTTTTTKGNKNKNNKRPTSLSSSFGGVETTTGDDDDVESSMWKAFKHMLKTNQAIADDVFMNPCSAAFTSGDPTMFCMSSNNQGSIITEVDDDISYQKLDTARHSMEVLALLIPHVIGVDKTAPGKILTTLCDAIPILIEEMMKVKVAGGNGKITTTSSKVDGGSGAAPAVLNNKAEKVYESLIASVLKCLVSTTAVASKETFTNNSTAKGKQIVSVTNNIMRNFPKHHGMNRDGCFVLQKVCKHLSKIERKRLGVVASLGNVVASDSIDQDVKDIADEILEEQFR